MVFKNTNLLKFYILSIFAAGTLFAAPSAQIQSLEEQDNNFIVLKSKDDSEAKSQDKQDTDFLYVRFEKISKVAKELIGIKYKLGGTTPNTGFDCSGFVKYVFNEGAGIKLPRSSREMRSVGSAVDLKSLKPGDLIFFKINTSHVGIYIGDNKFVHAPSTGRSVAVDNLMNSFFQNRIVGARRVINEQ